MFAQFKGGAESAEVVEELVVRLKLDTIAQMSTDDVIDLVGVDKQNSLVLGDDRISEEDRVEVDVGAAKVVQPSDFIEHVHDHGLVLL